MFFSSWLRNRKSSRGLRCQGPRLRPRLEALEDRWLPSTLTVTSPLDDGSSGTLRATIAAAASGDTIVFANSLNGQTITLNGSELLLNKNLNIQGLGATQLAISGNHLSRVFEVGVLPGTLIGPQVSLSGLTIEYGNAGPSYSYNDGGGIFNRGTLWLTGCNFSSNSADGYGGAIYSAAPSLKLDGCNFSGNSTAFGDGGGIYSDSPTTGTNCVFSNNSSAGSGGAIAHYDYLLSLSRCTFTANNAWNGEGGAIVHGGNLIGAINLTLSQCTLSGNSAHALSSSPFDRGGAISTSASTMLTACTLSGNSAAIGGAIYSSQGKGDSVTLSGCTLSGNSAANGGALWSATYSGSSLTVSACTITGNTAAIGGGIYNADSLKGALTITDSTITGNTATSKGGGIYNNGAASLLNTKVSNNSAGTQGGGIFNDVNGTLTLYSSSVVSGNSAPDGADLNNLGHVLRKKG
jgi:predicted outer membrane repeat protein